MNKLSRVINNYNNFSKISADIEFSYIKEKHFDWNTRYFSKSEKILGDKFLLSVIYDGENIEIGGQSSLDFSYISISSESILMTDLFYAD